MTLEAFLLIDQPRQRLGHWTAALASLDSPFAPAPRAVVAYYDPSADQALLNLQYDEAQVGERRLEFVVSVALLAEIGMVQPAELSEGERVRFLASRLSRCTIRVTSQPSAIGALTELVRELRRARNSQPIPSVSPIGAPPEPPVVSARGTRDDLEMLADDEVVMLDEPVSRVADVTAVGKRDDEPILLDLPLPARGSAPRFNDELSPPTTSRHIVARASRLATVELPPDTASQLARREQRTTSPMSAVEQRELVENDFLEEDDARHSSTAGDAPASAKSTVVGRRTVVSSKRRPQSEPYVPTGAHSNVIYARYLRGGRWVPVRVGALSLKGAALLTGALPRVDDRVDVALTFGTNRALVRGTVAKVSTQREAQSTGAATFSVTFKLDSVSKRQLTALLVAARDAKVTIKPPPPRATRRFPVEWQVAIATARGPVMAMALDVSNGGLFVRSPIALELGDVFPISMALDDGGAAVSARAKVVRRITEIEASACGLAPGYGLELAEMSEADRMRWLGFLARIERRAEKRVLVGADPARLAELQAGLASLGYAVSGGTDPGTLVQLANADSRPADAVLIDSGWLHNETSTSLVESLFSARNVPCVTMQGEVRRARQALDRLLEVVV